MLETGKASWFKLFDLIMVGTKASPTPLSVSQFTGDTPGNIVSNVNTPFIMKQNQDKDII